MVLDFFHHKRAVSTITDQSATMKIKLLAHHGSVAELVLSPAGGRLRLWLHLETKTPRQTPGIFCFSRREARIHRASYQRARTRF
jgi:hypothetical protein